MKSYIEELMGTLGIPQTTYSGLTSVSPQEIASGLAGTYGIDPSLLPSSLFTGVTPQLMQGTLGKTYSPLMQAKQQPLLQDLISNVGGQKGKQAFGGFAGSGQATDYLTQAKDVYGKGMTDVLTDVGTAVSSSEQNIIDLINSWKDTALSMRYGSGMV